MKGWIQTCLMVVCSWTNVADPGLKPDLSGSWPVLTNVIHLQQLTDTWQYLPVGLMGTLITVCIQKQQCPQTCLGLLRANETFIRTGMTSVYHILDPISV